MTRPITSHISGVGDLMYPRCCCKHHYDTLSPLLPMATSHVNCVSDGHIFDDAYELWTKFNKFRDNLIEFKCCTCCDELIQSFDWFTINAQHKMDMHDLDDDIDALNLLTNFVEIVNALGTCATTSMQFHARIVRPAAQDPLPCTLCD